MTGRDVADRVEVALRSVAEQDHPAVHVLLVDDASTDGTAQVARRLLDELFPGRHTLVTNRSVFGKARNCSTHLRAHLAKGTFVAVVDADDALAAPDVLSEVAGRYALGFDVVWTNFRTETGGRGRNRALDPFRSPRGQGWVTSHLFTFRAELLAQVPEDYFRDEQGVWLESAADFALCYPVLDQTRRYAFLPREGYVYTASNPASHHNRGEGTVGLSSSAQQRNAEIVLAKPPLPCTRFATEPAPVLHAALAHRAATEDASRQLLVQALEATRREAEAAPFTAVALQALQQQERVPLSWLRAVGGWALDVQLLHHLAEVLDRYPQPRVLELGSGTGTRVLAQLVANRGGSLLTLEHDVQWQQRTTGLLERAGLETVATVALAPLVEVEFYEVPGRFYDTSVLTDQHVFDIVVVDGPPTDTGHLARLPALPAVAPHLSPAGFHVFLDDFERDQEKQIVEVWRVIAPELHYEELLFTKAVCEITP